MTYRTALLISAVAILPSLGVVSTACVDAGDLFGPPERPAGDAGPEGGGGLAAYPNGSSSGSSAATSSSTSGAGGAGASSSSSSSASGCMHCPEVTTWGDISQLCPASKPIWEAGVACLCSSCAGSCSSAPPKPIDFCAKLNECEAVKLPDCPLQAPSPGCLACAETLCAAEVNACKGDAP